MKTRRCCGTCLNYHRPDIDDHGYEWGNCSALDNYLVGYSYGELCTIYVGPADEERKVTRLRTLRH